MYEQNNVCTQLHQSDEKIHINILNNVPPVERNSPARRQIADMQSKGTAQRNQTFSQTNRNHHKNTLMKSYDETRRTINNRKIQIDSASSRRYNSALLNCTVRK